MPWKTAGFKVKRNLKEQIKVSNALGTLKHGETAEISTSEKVHNNLSIFFLQINTLINCIGITC